MVGLPVIAVAAGFWRCPVLLVLFLVGLPILIVFAVVTALVGVTFGVLMAFLSVGMVALKIAFIVLVPLLILGWLVRRVFDGAGAPRDPRLSCHAPIRTPFAIRRASRRHTIAGRRPTTPIVNPTRDLDAVVVRRRAPRRRRARRPRARAGTGKNTTWLAEAARQRHRTGRVAGNAGDRARSAVTARRTFRFIATRHSAGWPIATTHRSMSSSVDLVLEHVERVGMCSRRRRVCSDPTGVLFVCELHPMRQILGGRAHFVDGEQAKWWTFPCFVTR